MRVWLVTIGEPVPVNDDCRDRLHRTGSCAKYLADHGHDVVWWTSTFDHFRKEHWFPTDHDLRIGDHLQVRLLYGGGYQSNTSPARFRDHRHIAAKFAQTAAAEARPDIIVAALPTVELCYEAVRFGQTHGVPVVLDMRDMWPDILVDSVPRLVRPAMRMLLRKMFNQACYACRHADAIIGITDDFVRWGVRRAGREQHPRDRSFPFGYVVNPPSADRIREAEQFWDDRGIGQADDWLAVFVGTLGRQLDVTTILDAARQAESAALPIRFVVCGTGDRAEELAGAARGLDNVVFPGWVDAATIHVLLRRAAVGLDPLPDRYDFLATVNNKAVEYMSAGLPVLSSPDHGALADLLYSEQCGWSYPKGDVTALTNLLAQLRHDTPRVKAASQRATQLFRNRYRADVVYQELMDYLEQVAHGEE